MLGFCSAVANKTIAALRAMCCTCDALFHSVMCCVNLSLNSRPTLPYGTRKVFLRHCVKSTYPVSSCILCHLPDFQADLERFR